MEKTVKIRLIAIVAAFAVLVASLAACIAVIARKNNYIKEIKTQISVNEKLIDEKSKTVSDLEKKLKESETENSKIAAELETAKGDKAKLEQENGDLKKQIENLSVQKPEPEAVPVYLPQAPPDSKVCYLTFDDGPSENTLRIIEILKQYNAKATFFVTNTGTTAYIKNIHDAGHAVGLHTSSHKYSEIYASDDAYFADLASISKTVKDITGVESKLVRFPGGSSNTTSRDICAGIMTRLTAELPKKGYAYFDWNVDSSDAEGRKSASQISNAVFNQAVNKNSVCVLMHDSAAKSTTVEALPSMLEGLRYMGYKFEALTVESYGYHHGVNN